MSMPAERPGAQRWNPPHSEEADMQLTPTITFRGVEPSAALEADIYAHIKKLETYYGFIMRCRVLVEFVQRHHEAGNRYHVRIDFTVPGEEIVVAHEGGLHATAQDTDAEKATKQAESHPERKHAHVAVREAFDAARRRLQDYARRQRGAVKAPVRQPHGRVVQLFPIDEYGYIEAEDGHEVYFQKSSVLKNAFDRLTVGSAVSFAEEEGEKGPQASTVKLLHPRRTPQPSSGASAEPGRR
jgi:cold shock CspA family protein